MGVGSGAPEAPARPARRTARHLPTSAATVGCGGRDEAAGKGGRGGGGGRVLAGTHLACDRAPRHSRFRSLTAEAASAAATAAHAIRQPRAASPQQLLRREGLGSATPPVAERSSWRRRGRAGTACAPDAGAGGSPGRRQRRPTGIASGTSTSMKDDPTTTLRREVQLLTGDGRASADRRGRRVAVQGFAALRAAPERRLVTRGSAETARGGPRRRRGAARCPRSFSLHGRRRSSCTTADACAAAGAARTAFPGLAEVPGRSEAPDRGDRVD